MPYFFRSICAGLIFAFASCLASPAAWANEKPKHSEVVQTFEPARNNGTPLVQVRFSNTVIGTFAIDTGEYESIITDDFAKRANFKLTPITIGSFFGSFRYQILQAPEIHLENLTVTGKEFRVVPQDFLPPFNGRAIDGILGGDLLSQFALRIDYPAHELIWITPGNLSEADAAALGFTPQNFIELGQERSFINNFKVNHYSLRADFQDKDHTSSEDLWIDTGSPGTLVSNALAEALSLSPRGTEQIATLSNPFTSASRCVIGKMQVGQAVLSDTSVLAPQAKDSGFPSLLGENVLSDCVVLFDFGPHRLYLRPVLPPVKQESAVPLDKTQIVWDRLRAAPDLPTVEEMLGAGLAVDAQDTVAERASRLRVPETDNTNEVKRLDELGVLLHQGQDEAGAKAAFTQAVTLAAAAAQAYPSDGVPAGQWVEALALADRDDEAIAAATLVTVRLPAYAPGWRQLGNVLTSYALFLLAGERITLTEAELLRLRQNVPDSVATPAQAALVQPLLTQAYTAFNKSITLAPADGDSYRDRAMFRLSSRIALSSMQQVGLKVTLPAREVPSEETALALAVADWQQCAALSPDDVDRLAATAFLDKQIPVFHDRSWLNTHLKGTDAALPATLMTTKLVETRLTLLTQSQDKTTAVSAWTALGTVQAQQGEISDTDSEASWRKALALDPAHDEALSALALHLYHASRWVELRDLLTHQTTVCDTVPTRLALAAVLGGENLPADAEAQVRAARALSPQNGNVNLVLADLLLARSGSDPAALAEASGCLTKARVGFGTLATDPQKATLKTSEAVWLALDHDPTAAEKALVTLAGEQPTCTQVREALAALVPYQ